MQLFQQQQGQQEAEGLSGYSRSSWEAWGQLQALGKPCKEIRLSLSLTGVILEPFSIRGGC